MENWGLKHPRKKNSGLSHFGLGMGCGWVGGGSAAAWRMYSASIWTHFLRMKSWRNPSTFCHWNMVQTSSNSGAPRSQFWFKVFFGERSDCKILAWGALDGLWAVGGQSRTSSWKKKMFVLGSYSGVHFWELKVPYQNYIDFGTYAFFLMVFSSESFLFKFHFLKILISESFHLRFQILWGFPCLRVGVSISQVGFLKVFISERCFFFHFLGGHSQSFHIKFHTFWLRLSISDGLHFCEFPFQISRFQQVSISES